MTRSIDQWKIDLLIGEDDGRTYAEARLVTEAGDHLIGVGRAQRSSEDPDVPEIGDEVAVARALRELSDRLLDTASGDLAEVTREPVHLSH